MPAKIFASARDSYPAAGFGAKTPNAEWVRVFVSAYSLGEAVAALMNRGLSRYIETVAPAEPEDVQAIAVGRFTATAGEVDTVVAVWRVNVDKAGVPMDAPLVMAAEVDGCDLVELGSITMTDDGPRIITRPNPARPEIIADPESRPPNLDDFRAQMITTMGSVADMMDMALALPRRDQDTALDALAHVFRAAADAAGKFL